MTGRPNPYRVLAEPSGGTDEGGHMRGYAWGPDLVNAVTMASLDRYRVTLNGADGVLVVQPQQDAVWVVPNAADGRGEGAIDGDGTWMYPTVIPVVTVGQPFSVHCSFLPMVEPVFWHHTSPIASAVATLDGTLVDGAPAAPGANWRITTESGAIHEIDFTSRFACHRRITPAVAAMGDLVDRYVQPYDLHDIYVLRVGEPIGLDTRDHNDQPLHTPPAAVTTITNLFDRGVETDSATAGQAST